MSKDWIVYFSHGVTQQWTLLAGEDINAKIKVYLKAQNAGETKSDRLKVLRKVRATKPPSICSVSSPFS